MCQSKWWPHDIVLVHHTDKTLIHHQDVICCVFFARFSPAYRRRDFASATCRHLTPCWCPGIAQNRYKSIICEEDAHFQELVRYIHLNPIRGHIVKNMSKLDKYPWCGHAAIMGNRKLDWQDRNYVLRWFGKKEKEATKNYRTYIQEGIAVGERADLVGGGLIRSLGGWSNVITMRRHGDRELTG